MKAFISYRRADTRHVAARVADRLNDLPGMRKVFIDVEDIEPASNFDSSIEESLKNSDICIVLIGENWLGAEQDGLTTRILRENDYVRRETATALANGIRVLPILVDGAPMPEKSELPPDVQPITVLDAVFLRHDSFNQDIEIVEDAIFKRKARTPIKRFYRRHPYLTLTLRAFVGMILAAVLLIVSTMIHSALTGGRALEETLGNAGVVWTIITLSLGAGAAAGIWRGMGR